ncbi:hypothetical protein [Streptomyces sp. NPDC088196]|uniref:hypothetical protein n=1 Tax=Streptomyces sp. NPDC088196 TaxID=3154868 RepID=UPI00345082B4
MGELIDATYDAAQLDVHGNLHRVVVEWRATARVLADPELTAQLTRRLPDEDHGEVTAGGRGRYLVDEVRHTVHLVYASTRHPKDTE